MALVFEDYDGASTVDLVDNFSIIARYVALVKISLGLRVSRGPKRLDAAARMGYVPKMNKCL